MHAGVAVPLAVVLGLLAVGLLIWRREYQIRHSSMRSTLAGLTLRGSESIPSNSQDLKLELDGKGEPLLLGQGSFGRVRSSLSHVGLRIGASHYMTACHVTQLPTELFALQGCGMVIH